MAFAHHSTHSFSQIFAFYAMGRVLWTEKLKKRKENHKKAWWGWLESCVMNFIPFLREHFCDFN